MGKILKLVILFLISFSLISVTVSSTELKEIQKAIKEKKARWIAGETSVSRLTPEQRKKLLGDIPVAQREIKTNPPLFGFTLPDSFDWRDKDGHNWMSSITNQGACGNCWAHASCGALEAVTRITLNEPDKKVNLSEMFLTRCSGRGCELGWDQSSTLNYIKNTGVPDEQCCPVWADECADTCVNRYIRSIFIEDWWHMSWPNIDQIKDRIMNYGPVTVHFEVFSDFYSYHSGVYKHVSGSSEGWHAVAFVGWSNTDSCWIVKNSWGTDWGEDGWFRVEMMTAGIHIDEEIWYMTVDTASVHEITVTRPDGGESFLAQETKSINWVSPYFGGNVKIDYTTNSGSSWINITPGTYNDGDYSWSVPNILSCNCMIKVSDAEDGDPFDESDNVFFIIQRGDIDKDCSYSLLDVISLANYLLKGGPPPDPLKLGDANCNGLINTSDVIFLATYILKGGPAPGC